MPKKVKSGLFWHSDRNRAHFFDWFDHRTVIESFLNVNPHDRFVMSQLENLFLGLLVSKMGYFWDIYKTAERARVSTSEASTRARSLARNFGEGCSHSLAAAENPRGPARARSLAQISEFFRTLAATPTAAEATTSSAAVTRTSAATSSSAASTTSTSPKITRVIMSSQNLPQT